MSITNKATRMKIYKQGVHVVTNIKQLKHVVF